MPSWNLWSMKVSLILSLNYAKSEPASGNFIFTESFPLLNPHKEHVRHDIADLKVGELPTTLNEGDLCLVLTNPSENVVRHLRVVVESIQDQVKNVSVSDAFLDRISLVQPIAEIIETKRLISYSATFLTILLNIGKIYSKYAPYETFAKAVEQQNRVYLTESPASMDKVKLFGKFRLHEKSTYSFRDYEIYVEKWTPPRSDRLHVFNQEK
ncbi:hypothetical protein ABG067_005370 [Albugo candida]